MDLEKKLCGGNAGKVANLVGVEVVNRRLLVNRQVEQTAT